MGATGRASSPAGSGNGWPWRAHFASRPRALLLDEPLGALDALTRLEMQGLIERVWQEHGFTAVLVTHDVEEAVALADRIIVLAAGQVALDLHVDLPRPRDHAARRFTEMKATILNRYWARGTRTGRRLHALTPAPRRASR